MAFNTSPGRAEYTATAGQTLFTFTFKIYATANVLVYLTPSGQTPNDTTDILLETTDYKVVINGDNGGDVTLTSGASAGDSITLVRSLPIDRDTEFQANGDFTASTINADQDYQTYLLLDNALDLSRSIKVPDTAQGFTTELPPLIPGNMFIINNSGDGINLIDPQATNFFNDDAFIVSSMTALLSVDYLTYGSTIVKGYYAQNDGGGGLFNWDSTIDKSTANAGTIIDPSVSIALQGTGVGTGCWVRQYEGSISLKMFGAIDDDLTDNGTAITYINTYLADNVKRVAAGLGAPFLQTYVTKLIISGGIYKTSVALTLPPGSELEFDGGAVLKAYANDQDILVSTTPTWNAANLSLYGARSIKVSGTGVLDGDDKASRGMVLDTVATGSSFENISIMRCTKSRYVTTGAGTLGTPTLTIASGTAKVGDVITIAGEVDGPTDTYFRVIGVAGTVLTLSGNLTITHTTSVVTHFAVGLTCMMVQQSVINVTTYGNSIGSVFMKNIDGFNCTDITFVGGGNENNKYAGAIFANIRGSKFYGTRYQHTTDGPEIISYGSVGNRFYNIYVESASDAEIASDSSLTLAQMQAIQMIYISSSSSSNDMDIRWPNNTGTTTWRRLIHNKGGSIEVSITTQVGALNPNPLLGTDYAPILQDSTTGQIYLNGFYGQTTVLTADKAIIDETSTYMPPNRSFARLRTNARETSAGGSSRAYGLNTATNIQEHYVYGDTQPRLQILTTELRLGSGSATPDVRLSRAAADTFGIGAGDSIRLPDVTNGGGAGGNTATTLQMTDANGVIYHLWVDTAGKLRIHTSKNVVENTAGVVVGTQV